MLPSAMLHNMMLAIGVALPTTIVWARVVAWLLSPTGERSWSSLPDFLVGTLLSWLVLVLPKGPATARRIACR